MAKVTKDITLYSVYEINKYTPVIDILIRIKYIITIVKIIMKSLIY